MREKADYRDNLALLRDLTDGKLLISLSKAAEILGKDTKQLRNTKEIRDMMVEVGKRQMLPVVSLARWMS